MKNKTATIIVIVFLAIVSILLTIFMILAINHNTSIFSFNIGNAKVSNNLVLGKTYEEYFASIAIDADASVVEIKHNDSSFIKAEVYGNEEEITFDEESESLHIKIVGHKCIGICFKNTIAKVVLYLPSDYAGNLNIKNSYGDISVAELLNSNINIDVKAGDVSVDSAKDIVVNTNYGDTFIGSVNKATINANAGDVKVNVVNDIEVNNNYGDITITEVNNYLLLNDDCGDINVKKANILKDSAISNSFGDIKVGSTNEIFIDAKTSLGNVSVNNNYRNSDITLKISNSCGDIKVTN